MNQEHLIPFHSILRRIFYAMSKMRLRKYHMPVRAGNHHQRQNKRLRLYKSMPGLPDLLHSGDLMRIMRHGKGQNKDHHNHEACERMSKLRKSLVELIYEIGEYSGCHQMPERSFYWKGRQFPVCARCTGVGIGQALALLLWVIDIPLSMCLCFLTLMGLDWGLQECKIKESTNYRRLFTGILGGFGLFSIYVKAGKWMIRKLRRQ